MRIITIITILNRTTRMRIMMIMTKLGFINQRKLRIIIRVNIIMARMIMRMARMIMRIARTIMRTIKAMRVTAKIRVRR